MRTMILSVLLILFGAGALAETKDTPPPPMAPTAKVAKDADSGNPIAEIAREAGLSSALVAKLSPEQLSEIVKTHRPRRQDEVPAVATVVPIALFIAVLLIVLAGLYAAYRKDGHRHETIRKLIEKEAAIPPELLTPPTRRSDLRRGLLFAGSGLGLTAALLVMPDTNRAWALGAIPLFIGLGYLIAWRIEGRTVPSDS